MAKKIITASALWDIVLIRETAVPVSYPTKQDIKSKIIRFAKDRQPSLSFFVVCISHFEEKCFKKWQKSKDSLIYKLVKTCAEYLPK